MKFFILLISFIITLSAANFQRDNGRNIVIDQETGLVWMDSIDNMKIMLSHKEAVPFCEDLQHAGFNDWRIPHIKEYELIVDKTNDKNYINKTFKYNQKAGYWAKTAHFRTLWFYADYMYFISGTPYFDSRFKKKFVRCVRDSE